MWFVYYHDGADELGGKDLEQFETKKEALDFLSKRAESSLYALKRLNVDYTLIEGRAHELIAVERVTKVAIKDDSF